MDRGIRPYASSAKTYNEMLDEETEQYYRSRNYNINPSLKQPYMFKDYTEMMYLYSGGIRPYASSAKNYNEMMDEETEQYYRSRNYNINPSLKQPYTFNNYTEMMYLYSGGIRPYASSAKNYNEMMYLYSGGEQRPSSDKYTMDANMFPVVLATVTSPDYELFDFFVEDIVTNILVDETFTNLDDWTTGEYGNGVIHEINPVGEFHGYVIFELFGGDSSYSGEIATTFTGTNTPVSQTIEFEIQIDSMDSGGIGVDDFRIRYAGMPTTNFIIYFAMSGVFVFDGASNTQIGTVVPSTGSYQKWRVVNTSTGASTMTSELFLESGGVYTTQGTVNCTYGLDSPLSDLKFSYLSKSLTTATEIHMKNIKLYYA